MIEKLPEIEGDKANHFIYGLLITAIVLFLGLSIPLAIFTCAIVAFSKELYDKNITRFSWLDVIFTVGGGLISILISLIDY